MVGEDREGEMKGRRQGREKGMAEGEAGQIRSKWKEEEKEGKGGRKSSS